MRKRTLVFLTFLILLNPLHILSAEEQDLNVDFSLLAGLLLPGELFISTGSVDTYPETAMSPFFILALDLSQSKALSFGAYYQFTNMGYDAIDGTDIYHTFGLCISPLFYTKTITIKPNIKLGYRGPYQEAQAVLTQCKVLPQTLAFNFKKEPKACNPS